ncbi:sodium-translocating pyrophosphatase [Candidatus Azambacteria bacterium RIFCSPHIGHO2_01_FULL_44_55]|uniref:K(+)-insensitive pyrophosphate-energized proton pump n=1 Tax=Candidatus Azambacteria bacterium RIFCSPLOWO2_02_FULL_44_14 TaxID=1797306 RepID=A0A1F5CAP5_9BACT|nr:MAG: sodium-translocating pyrophosphatase [Candidatus Azambacteria bacterium RIFCSPLOWO2_01_FULL_44_84]OGD33621.1 MAG: sodium-translocating pyrophosphatase [Candidatus Azambacteria bacterium RIFCSPHIGHO2_02_FULL_45_18]OGD39907.1 MAG: sodium-translocating pyrophosphatase [Candidatus Azambacteria bacterium RIFCSPLOWO2_02_FULL_44_14]OGD40797.1 MAG: sodium-translocating pyrophosphatase [Candidatus Azambacteria bacterium RIFCSPHIGHO2_01_FULL_44_55]
MVTPLFISMLFPVLALGVAAWFVYWIMTRDQGTSEMKKVAGAIREGAAAFMNRQYKTIGLISVVVALGLWAAYYFTDKPAMGWQTALAFMLGSASSAVSGIIGMSIAVRSNGRSAAAAKKSFNEALTVAFRGGAVSGLTIISLSLIGIAGLFGIYRYFGYEAVMIPSLIVGYGFGASLVALFAQLGGGIYTKAADVGADLVGKIEAGIPEDDPRNPAVVADLVGDNVGDCAGRGADLFESTAAENIGAMILGVALYPYFGISGVLFPLVLRAFGLLASIVGVLFVRARENDDPMSALNRGYFITSGLAAVAFYFVTQKMLGNMWFFWAGMIGIATSIVFVYITQYYTESKFRPVKEIAEASKTGHATNIITGYAVGLESTGLTVVTISAALLSSYWIGSHSGVPGGGLYGTAVATMGMLASAAYILAMDTFGPIVDNGAGIAEMSGESGHMRDVMDKLDSAGNTTKALTKGYAIGSAALAAFLLFSAYLEEVHIQVVNLFNIKVFVAALIGAMLVFLFSSLAIRAVGKAAYSIINEVRRQFKEHPGIMRGEEKPDYSKAVDITTRGALRQMVLPGVLAVAVPVIVGLTLGAEAEAGLIMVGTITGILMATLMNNAGGAWDNAKKWIEEGNLGGKNSPAHQAAVTGDTVGDPFKDTAGPSLHVLIKLLATLTLALAALFV